MFRSEEAPQNRSPTEGTSRLRRPDPPIGAFPVFRCVRRRSVPPAEHEVGAGRDVGSRRGCSSVLRCRVLRPRPHTAQRRQRRSVLRGDARRRCGDAQHPPARRRSTNSSTPSARRCRRWRSPGRRRRSPRVGRGRRSSPPPRTSPNASSRWCNRSRRPFSRCTARRAGRSCSATTTPYDLVKPFRRPVGARRRGRHPLRRRRARRGRVRRLARRAVRVVGRQARRGAGVGRRARCRPRGELRLLRQRLRHAAARRGRQSGRGQPRPAHGGDGGGTPVAHPRSRHRAPGRVAQARSRVAEGAAHVQPSVDGALRRHRHPRCRTHPGRRVR